MTIGLDFALQIAFGVIAFLGGLWVNRMQKDIDGLTEQIADIHREYQRREDASNSTKQVVSMLRDVQTHVQRIEDKLDRKADKP